MSREFTYLRSLSIVALLMLMVLNAPMVVMLPVVLCVALYINDFLSSKAYLRSDLRFSRVLSYIYFDIDVPPLLMLVFALVMTVVQLGLFALVTLSTAAETSKQMWEWLLYALVIIEISIMVVVACAHVVLRLVRMDPTVSTLACGGLSVIIASVGYLINAPALFIIGMLVVAAGSICLVGLAFYDPNEKNNRAVLGLLFIVMMAVAFLFGNPTEGALLEVVGVVAFIESLGASAFLLFGVILIVRARWEASVREHE